MHKEIAISVICNAYNHEAYIAQCIEGIVMQKTNFLFEVLIHDDASTDQTANIIRMYEKKYPELIKPIYQTENQYSRGGVGRFQYPRVKGKYIALCEGDDYWTDPLKLQKQYDALEANPGIDICAHAAVMVNGTNGKKIMMMQPDKRNTILPVENVIRGGGGYVATNSLVYRTELLENLPPFRQKCGLDYAVQIHGSLRGGMLYLNDSMSVYRFQTAGSWTSSIQQSKEKRNKVNRKVLEMLQQVDIDTQGRYHVAIQDRIRYNEVSGNDDYRRQLAKENRKCYLLKPSFERRRIFIKACFPRMYRLWKQLRSK